jgi:hypothetical protein
VLSKALKDPSKFDLVMKNVAIAKEIAPVGRFDKIAGRSTPIVGRDEARLPIQHFSLGENRLKNRFNFVVSNGDFS